MKKGTMATITVALSTAAILALVQCAPKPKDKDAAVGGNQNKTTGSSLVEGLDFSALEKSNGNPSAKALLKTLKENKTPDGHILAMALMELHLRGTISSSAAPSQSATDDKENKDKDGKDKPAKTTAAKDVKTAEVSAEDKKMTEAVQTNLARVMKLAESVKAKKMEELKKIYSLIKEETKRNMRYNPKSVSVMDVLDKGELQEYSGTSLLALTWLSTSFLSREKAFVLIEDGRLQLAERRTDKGLMALESLSEGLVGRDAGSMDEMVKSTSKRLVQLDLFVIHEALKSFAANPKDWSLRIQKVSNKANDLKIDEKSLKSNSASVDKSQINQSEILIGNQVEKGTFDLVAEEQPVPAAAAAAPGAIVPAGKTPAKNETGNGAPAPTVPGAAASAPSASAAPTLAAPETPAAPQAAAPAASAVSASVAGKNAFLLYQTNCLSVAEFRKVLAAAKAPSLLSLLKSSVVQNGEKLYDDESAPMTMIRLEAIDASKLNTLDRDLEKLVKDGKEDAGKDQTLSVVLAIAKDEGRLVGGVQAFEKATGKYVKQLGNTVLMKDEAASYLQNYARKTKASEDKAVILEPKAKENCQ